MIDYCMKRSLFWLRVYEEDDYVRISANSMVKDLIDLCIPTLVDCSPNGWRASKTYDNIFSLWIPDNCLNPISYSNFKLWAEHSSSHIWLGTNKNTHDFFRGDELNYCLAAGWNFDIETGIRTRLGLAEYQLKYQVQACTSTEAKQYSNDLLSAIMDCIRCLPLNCNSLPVSAIPAVPKDQTKLSWQLAKQTSNCMGVPFAAVSLHYNKPQMKQLPINEKIRVWREIYENDSMLYLPFDLSGKDILIIDDLYQSGASAWCYAEFLKNRCSARTVIAISSVKAMKDGDNT